MMRCVASTTNLTAVRSFTGLAANGFECGCLQRAPKHEEAQKKASEDAADE